MTQAANQLERFSNAISNSSYLAIKPSVGSKPAGGLNTLLPYLQCPGFHFQPLGVFTHLPGTQTAPDLGFLFQCPDTHTQPCLVCFQCPSIHTALANGLGGLTSVLGDGGGVLGRVAQPTPTPISKAANVSVETNFPIFIAHLPYTELYVNTIMASHKLVKQFMLLGNREFTLQGFIHRSQIP